MGLLKFLSDIFTHSDQQINNYSNTETEVLNYHMSDDGITKIETTNYTDGSVNTHFSLSPKTSSFYDLSDIISNEKDIQKKLDACEKSYELLPGFVKECIRMDNELPPIINCRDKGPILYMRLGEWEKARRAIFLCMNANAYYPEDGQGALSFFNTYKKVAEATIQFLKENPGYLQKDIYNALNFEGEEREALKSFLRSSLQITKVKQGNTNKLYVH